MNPSRAALVVIAALAFALPGAARASQADDEALWTAYKAKFLTEDGRIVDEAAGRNVSHSEGQGYGLLLAALNDDQVAFDKMFVWTAANLYVRGDDLAAWRWVPADNPHVADMNNATDGDILIAWALAEAAKRFNRPDYLERARRISHVVAWSLTYPAPFGLALAPGKVGFGPKDGKDGPVVNPSYWVYPAFTAFQSVTPDVDWARIAAGGRELLTKARFGKAGLPADWISLKDGEQPAQAYPARFSYDAVRVPLYLAWDAPTDKAALQPFVDSWALPPGTPLSTVSFDGVAKVNSLNAPGYRAIAALARCIVNGEPFPAALRTPVFEQYFSATLHMLVLAAMRDKGLKCA